MKSDYPNPQYPFAVLKDHSETLAGKTAIVRTCLNVESGYDDIDSSNPPLKVLAAIESLRWMLDRGLRVILLAHLGSKGSPAFGSLETAVELIEAKLKRPCPLIFNQNPSAAADAIKNMLDDNELAALDNVRFFSDEILPEASRTRDKYSRTPLVQNIAPLAQIYVNDAFPSAHRPHASIIGFSALPHYAGPWFVEEYKAACRATELAEKPYVLVIGGRRVAQLIPIIKHLLGSGTASELLATGLLAHIFMIAKNQDCNGLLKAELNRAGQTPDWEMTAKLLEDFSAQIALPNDLVFENPSTGELEIGNLSQHIPQTWRVRDIGPRTQEEYIARLKDARTVLLKGSPGKYETPAFSKGSRALVEELARLSDTANTIVSGGDTTTMVNRFGYTKNDFSGFSLSGSAFLQFLIGREAVGIRALRDSQPGETIN